MPLLYQKPYNTHYEKLGHKRGQTSLTPLPPRMYMRLGFVPWVAYRYSRISRCQKSRVKPCRIDRESARDRGRMLDCACGAIENAIRERGAAQSVHQQPVVSSENQGGGRSRLIYFVWRSGEQPAAACRSLTDYAILPPNKVHDELCRTKHMFTDCSRVVVFPSSCTCLLYTSDAADE